MYMRSLSDKMYVIEIQSTDKKKETLSSKKLLKNELQTVQINSYITETDKRFND